MRRRFIELGAVLVALAALALLSGPAMAQKTSATLATGTVSTGGTITRTIIDVGPAPNEPILDPAGLLRVQSVISIPVVAGVTPDNADSVGNKIRVAINAALLPGYSTVFTAPSGTSKQSRPKLVRQQGGYTESDNMGTVTGITLAPSAFTVEDAPGFSPVGLGFLVGALPALAFWHRRRRTAA